MAPHPSAKNYVKGSVYELFILSVFKCKRGQHGAEGAILKNLLDTEDGHNYVRVSHEKQLSNLKKYLEKAFEKIKTDNRCRDLDEIHNMHSRVLSAKSGEEIFVCLEVCLELIRHGNP